MGKKREIKWFDFDDEELEQMPETKKRKFKNAHPAFNKIKEKELLEMKKDKHLLPKDLKINVQLFYKPFLIPRESMPRSRPINSGFNSQSNVDLVDDPFDDFPDFGGDFGGGDDDFGDDLLPLSRELSQSILQPPEQTQEEKLKIPFETSACQVN